MCMEIPLLYYFSRASFLASSSWITKYTLSNVACQSLISLEFLCIQVSWANRIPFSFIYYAAHCTAWLSYGKRLWPSAAAATCYLARNPKEKGFRRPYKQRRKRANALPQESLPSNIDCEQSLFSSKIREDQERKTSKYASVTVSMTWMQRCSLLLVARLSIPTLLAARGGWSRAELHYR